MAGTVRPQKRSQSLIGVVRRQAAAAARREELAREQSHVQRELEQTRAAPRAGARRRDAGGAARARALAEVAHMLDEVEQRRVEMRALREAEEAASVQAGRRRARGGGCRAEEEDARAALDRRHDAISRRWPIPPSLTARASRRCAGGRRLPSRDPPRHAAAWRSCSTRVRSAEDTHDAESESLRHGARAHASRWIRRCSEAQRILNQARNALRAAGLENVEARITQLQRQLKDGRGARAPDRRGQGHRAASARGRADRRMRQQRRRWRSRRRPTSPSAATPSARCSHAVADSLDLPANQVDDPVRYARQTDQGPREPHSASTTTCRAPSAPAEREQEGFLVAVGEYQAMVGADDRFGLRAPGKRELALAPQGWLLDVAPRLEGTSDIRLLLNYLGCHHRAIAADARAARHARRARHHPRRGGEPSGRAVAPRQEHHPGAERAAGDRALLRAQHPLLT